MGGGWGTGSEVKTEKSVIVCCMCVHAHARVCARTCVCVCVCVCERESLNVCVTWGLCVNNEECVYEREKDQLSLCQGNSIIIEKMNCQTIFMVIAVLQPQK